MADQDTGSSASKATIEDMANDFILELKKSTYGVECGNRLEGDYGSWDDWEKALVTFVKRVIANQ